MKPFNMLLGLALSAASLTATHAQTLIWGGAGSPDGEFANGLNNWTATGLNSSDPSKADAALWVHKPNGKADQGAFWGTLEAIKSASVANGAAVFDSDFLDNGGDGNNLGGGVCPSPHKGVLTSPVIDCSAYSSVAVQFTQFYRSFTGTASSIEVTNDGETWVPFLLNEDVPDNQAGVNGDKKVINISSVASNQAAVQFRFSFNGDYYFWIVDDVSLTTLPDNDLVAGIMYYSPSAFQTPRLHIRQDTFFFACEITNAGGADQTDVKLKAIISNTVDNSVMYQDSIIIDNIPAGTKDSLFQILDYLLPGEMFAPGTYRLTYTITGINGDITPGDNTKNETFVITENLWSKDNGISQGIQPAPQGDYAIGNYYKLNSDPNITTVATQTTFSCSAGSPQTLNGRSVSIFLIEVHCEDDFSDFSGTQFYGTLPTDEMQLVGLASYEFTASDANYATFTVDLVDIEGNPGITLKPGGKYFIVTHYAGALNTIIFHAVSGNIDFSYKNTVSPVWNEADKRWYTQGFGSDDAVATQRLVMDITSNTKDEHALPESAMNVFPNPVKDKMTVNLDLGNQNQGWLHIVDISGKVLETRDLQNAGKQTLSLDMSGYASGAYFLRLSTAEGTRTIKVMLSK